MILKKSMANFRLTVKKEAFYQGIPGPGHWFFFIHILKRQYDKNYKNVYHIAFYHILKISKSLSYLLYHIFKYTKKCLSPEGNCESGARWGPLDSLSILYVDSERKLTISILRVKSAFLKISKTFIPRREVRKHARWGPIDFLMVYCHSALVN